MNHFDITQWTDFARGVTAVADRGVMEAHVVSGCARCRETLSLVKRVVESARIDNASDPPEHVVRCAKALSALRPQRKSRRHADHHLFGDTDVDESFGIFLLKSGGTRDRRNIRDDKEQSRVFPGDFVKRVRKRVSHTDEASNSLIAC